MDTTQEKPYEVVSWFGLYGESWADDIVPEAFSHPAKYSRALIRHIYQYLIDNHLIERGARVLDPFGGVALGALDAQLQGLHWIGCELEPKFVTLGNANLALWDAKYRPHFPRWGSARLLQGDSRRIAEVIRGSVNWDVDNNSRSHYTETHEKTTGRPNSIQPVSVGEVDSRDSGKFWSERGGSTEEDNKSGIQAKESIRVSQVSIQDGQTQTVSEIREGSLGMEGRRSKTRISEGDKEGEMRELRSSTQSVHPSQRFQPFQQHTGELTSSLCSLSSESSSQGIREIEESRGDSKSVNEETSLAVNAIVASPPFIQTSGGTNVTSTDGPLSDARLIERHSAGNAAMEAYGNEAGQLQNMPEGDINAIVASPPYASQPVENGGTLAGWEGKRRIGASQNGNEGYGNTDGQLGTLPEGDVEAVVSSPPYAQIEQSGSVKGLVEHGTGLTKGASAFDEYGSSEGQLGREQPDSFWSASLAIASQCYTLLAPGGVAVWVTKRYVRNKRIVEFSKQWEALCNKVGFKTIVWVRAMLVEDNGTQLSLEQGKEKSHRKKRASFFRRLAEAKGSPAIDWEDVIIMRK